MLQLVRVLAVSLCLVPLPLAAASEPREDPIWAKNIGFYQYSISLAGSGAGWVRIDPPGIDCRSSCLMIYGSGLHVTLTATADPGSVFVGWKGICKGASPTCSFQTIPLASSARAYFNPPSPDKRVDNEVPLEDVINGPVGGGTWNYYFVDLQSGNGELTVELLDLDGDASLYVRSGSKPDHDNYDCRDDSSGTPTRQCVLANPAAGRWWIGVNNTDEEVAIPYTVQGSWSRPDIAMDFYTVAFCRLVDTRVAGQPLVSGVPRTLQITGVCGIPATARAVSANLTVSGSNGAGYVTLYPVDEQEPSSRTLVFGAGRTLSSNAVLSLGYSGTGALDALAGIGTGGQVHLILDVTGYFQ